MDHRLDRLEHVLLLDKGHLQIELVEFARRAVGARILVTETGCDLKIAIEARHHEELLILLRCLRQGVELAGMDTRRHQKVASAFRRRGGQDRRLELGKVLLLHTPPYARNHLGAQHDIGVHMLPSQIEEAVAKPGLFRKITIAVHLDRELFGGGFERKGIRHDLDFAGRQVRIDGLVASSDHIAGDRDDAFHARMLGLFEKGLLRLKDHLGQAEMISEIDKEKLAMIPLSMDPAGKPDFLADIGGAKAVAMMGAIGMHVSSLLDKGLL